MTLGFFYPGCQDFEILRLRAPRAQPRNFKVLATWVKKIPGSFLGCFYFRIGEQKPKKSETIFFQKSGRPIVHCHAGYLTLSNLLIRPPRDTKKRTKAEEHLVADKYIKNKHCIFLDILAFHFVPSNKPFEDTNVKKLLHCIPIQSFLFDNVQLNFKSQGSS